MTTGEKIAALRRKKGLTQEQISEKLKVSRQSVSRWEMDIAFPETEKLIKLSKLLECSIDFLLNDELQKKEELKEDPSIKECYNFIRECGYFVLGTSADNKPRLRPMGMIYSDDKALYIATDKRKKVYAEVINNPYFELTAYHLNSNRWLRISGGVEVETSGTIAGEMRSLYPMISQEYAKEEEMYFVILKLLINEINKY